MSRWTTLEERFWSHVDKSGECWVWTGALYSSPKWRYGKFYVAGKICAAHRVSYEIVIGPVDVGMCVLHRCDNPPCVRPDHLFLGSFADNSADMAKKGRSTFGERNPRAKLTDREVRAIRSSWDSGARRMDLAVRFNVSQQMVHNIVYRKAWRHI